MSGPTTIGSSRTADGAGQQSIKVIYLFTTFPKLSETFLQREIRSLRRLPIELRLFSLWGGEKGFEGMVVHRFPKVRLLTLLWLLPYWLCRKPAA